MDRIVVYTWISFLLAVAAALIGVAFARRRLRLLPTRRWIILFAPYLFPLVVLTWGALFRWDGPEDAEPYWHVQVAIWLMLLVYPAFCGLSIWRSPGLRLLAIALIPLSLFFSLAALLFAVLALVND